jgi:hypothetical protein
LKTPTIWRFSNFSQVFLNWLCELTGDICLPSARKRFLRFLAGKLRQLAAVSEGDYLKLQIGVSNLNACKF